MKKLFYLLMLFLAIVINAQTIVSYDFNLGAMGWTLSSNTSATGGKIFMNGDDGGIRTATSPVIDLTGNSSVSLSVDWNCVDSSSGFESDDRIYIQYLNGSTWSTIWSKTGNDICPNTNDNQSGNTGVLNLSVALSSTRIRLVSDTNSTSEDINWDNVVVSVATASCDPIVWYHTSNDKLFTANLATGQSTEVCSNFDASGSTIYDIGFTPSGSELYAVVSGGTLRRVTLPGCTFTTITKAASSPETIPTSSLNSLSFLPDGSALVGSSSTRIIYRVVITGNTYSATQWTTIPNENSITGSSGDFILLGDKVYAALTTGSREWLYEIKINPTTYAPISATPSVSIVGKYQGPSGGARMYGMSAIYGKLYGGFDDNTVKEITLTGGSPTGTFSLSSNKLSGFASDDIYGMTSTLEGLGGEDPAISAGGLTSFCPGGSVVLTSEVQQNNQWYKDGEAIPGATNSTYMATTTGEYTVRVSYGTGCFTNFSNPIVVTANDCIDAADDTYTNVPAGSTTASVIVNDTLNGSVATIGTTSGTVTIHTLINSTGTQGPWVTGFTLNPNGTITLATTVATGTYTLYYKICNQEETVCNIATVTLMVVTPYDCTGKIYSLSSVTGEIRVFNTPATSGALGTVVNTTTHPTALSPAPNGPNALGYSVATNKFYS